MCVQTICQLLAFLLMYFRIYSISFPFLSLYSVNALCISLLLHANVCVSMRLRMNGFFIEIVAQI